MASYTIVKNQSLFIDLNSDFSVQGWEVSGNIAYHSGCNPGYIKNSINLKDHTEWTFKYRIISLTSGSIKLFVNGVEGSTENTVGEHTNTFTGVTGNVEIKFYSNGVNAISLLQVYPTLEQNDGTTLAFNEDANRFITYFSYQPDFMLKFMNRFFTFKNGSLWENNVNNLRNTFYGTKYPSELTFFVNGADPEMVKTFYSIIVNSNDAWGSEKDDDIYIFPNGRKPNGMQSRLKKGNYKNIQGKYYADFLKNIIDPRFTNPLDALMKGADLQGPIMQITIRNNSDEEVRLISVEVTYVKQNYTK